MTALPIQRLRTHLPRARAALRRGAITLGFIGGSITDPRPGCNWPEPVAAWFNATYPEVRVTVENAAIGATSSDSACFRARANLLERGCDLVFVEYAVNDGGEPTGTRRRWREGLVRQLLADGGRDVLFAYTFSQPMYADMHAGRLPPSIAELEELAAHYGIGSAWMGLAALREVEAGAMPWEVWLPDGLHPQHRGSLSYAQAVIAHLREALAGEPPAATAPALPIPLDPAHWQAARILPWSDVTWQGPWVLRRDPQLAWVGPVLTTNAPGARLSFAFDGRACALCFDFGTLSGEFRWRLDGGDWQTMQRDRPSWVGPGGWLRIAHLADDLQPGRHVVELETIHGGETCKGTACKLVFVGIVG